VRTVRRTQKTSLTSEELVELAARTLVANKGEDPLILDVRGVSSLWDYFIICSGGSKRHVQALAQHLQEALGQAGVKPMGAEGLEDGQWVLLDYVDVVFHLFIRPMREFYDLEGLWVEATRLPVKDLTANQIQGQPHT
jgi:ribosome-associated protein